MRITLPFRYRAPRILSSLSEITESPRVCFSNARKYVYPEGPFFITGRLTLSLIHNSGIYCRNEKGLQFSVVVRQRTTYPEQAVLIHSDRYLYCHEVFTDSLS